MREFKDSTIKEVQESRISNIEFSEKFILESENENLKSTLKIKEETIQIQEDHINSLTVEIEEIKSEMEKNLKEYTNEINRKNVKTY